MNNKNKTRNCCLKKYFCVSMSAYVHVISGVCGCERLWISLELELFDVGAVLETKFRYFVRIIINSRTSLGNVC